MPHPLPQPERPHWRPKLDAHATLSSHHAPRRRRTAVDRGPKPKKPYPKFPLTAHASGTWCKKVGGKQYHFGPWHDPKGALKNWEREAPRLRQGRRPAAEGDAQIVRTLCNRWLVERLKDLDGAKITSGYFNQCRRAVRMLLKSVGEDRTVGELTPDDFRDFGRVLEAKYSPATIRLNVRVITSLFTYAADEDWIDRPVKLGKRFKELAHQPDEAAAPVRARTPAEVRAIIGHAQRRLGELKAQGERSLSPMRQLIAGIWLAVNGGYGSADLATLPRDVVDLDNAVIDYRRGKTPWIKRVVPLMPETVAALRAVLAERPGDELVFRTREGNPWRREIVRYDDHGQWRSVTNLDNFNQLYVKLLKHKSVKMKRPRCGFYELRHSHAEMADAAGDPHAASRIMGHSLHGMKDIYVRVTIDRLRAVVNYIRRQVAPAPAKKKRARRRTAKKPSRRRTRPSRRRTA